MGGLLLIKEGSTNYQVGYDDGQNVTTLIKADTGEVVASYDFGPFGEPIRVEGAYSNQNPIRYSSVYTDSETGLLYYRFRYYNPQTGGWLSRDPLQEAGGINLTQFVFNNPLSGIDLLGLGTYQLGTQLPPKRTNTDLNGGSGTHGSWKAYWGDYKTWTKWANIAAGAMYVYPDAGRHMAAYLANTGRTLTVGVGWMVQNSGRATAHFHSEINSAMKYAEELADSEKFKSFSIVGTWDPGANDKIDSGNWFYAVGEYDAVGSAVVTVLPNCEYKMVFTYTFFDRYNWDQGKKIDVLGHKVYDDELGRLHKVGLAKEYEMTGEKKIIQYWKKGFRHETHWRNLMSDGRTGR